MIKCKKFNKKSAFLNLILLTICFSVNFVFAKDYIKILPSDTTKIHFSDSTNTPLFDTIKIQNSNSIKLYKKLDTIKQHNLNTPLRLDSTLYKVNSNLNKPHKKSSDKLSPIR